MGRNNWKKIVQAGSSVKIKKIRKWTKKLIEHKNIKQMNHKIKTAHENIEIENGKKQILRLRFAMDVCEIKTT